MRNYYRAITVLTLSLLHLSANVEAARVDIPNEFSSGTPAVAAEVNANFASIEAAVNDNDNRVSLLEQQLVEAQEPDDFEERIAALENTFTSLRNTIIILQTTVNNQRDYVRDLEALLSVSTDDQGNPALIVSGANFHINNGSGLTGIVNGVGNLVIGYDEEQTSFDDFCSNGELDDEPACLDANETWGISQKTGSHNIVVGSRHSYTQHSGIVAGFNNSLTGSESVMLGGTINLNRGFRSTIVGGSFNEAGDFFSNIFGGSENTAFGFGTTIVGDEEF